MTFGFIFFSLKGMTINTFLTYGSYFLYGGIACLCLSLCYRFIMNFILASKYRQRRLSKQTIRLHHRIAVIAVLVSLIMMLGGLIEDTFNHRNVTLEEHPLITLKDLDIEGEVERDYTKQSGFQVHPFYYSLEYTKDQKYILYTNQYHLSSDEKAKDVYHDLISNPLQLGYTKIKDEGQVGYGYIQDEMSCLLIQNQDTVTVISFNFVPNQKQIDTTLSFYQK